MNMDNETFRFLARSDLFKGLSEKHIRELKVILTEKQVIEDESIFHEKESEGPLYLIRSGTVQIVMQIDRRDPANELQILKDGELFGEFSFIDRLDRSASARAMEDTLLYVLSRDIFDKYAQQRPGAAYIVIMNIAAVLAARFRKTNLQLIEDPDEDY